MSSNLSPIKGFVYVSHWCLVILFLNACSEQLVQGGSDTETQLVPAKSIIGEALSQNDLPRPNLRVQAIPVDYVPFKVSKDSSTISTVIEVYSDSLGVFQLDNLMGNQQYNLLIVDSIHNEVSWLDSVSPGTYSLAYLSQAITLTIQKEVRPYESPDEGLFVYVPGTAFIQPCDGETTQIRYLPEDWQSILYYIKDIQRGEIPLSDLDSISTIFIDNTGEWSKQ